MNNKKKDMIISVALISVMAVLLGYNFYIVQGVRAVTWKREEYHSGLEAQQLEKAAMRKTVKDRINAKKYQRQKTVNEIVEFNGKYILIRDNFLGKVESLSTKFDSGVVSIEELKQLTAERIAASEMFKQELLSINRIPEPIEDFYGILSEFLEKDIENWNLILAYYSGGDPQEDLDLSYRNINDLYHKAEDKRIRTYIAYELEDLLE